MQEMDPMGARVPNERSRIGHVIAGAVLVMVIVGSFAAPVAAQSNYGTITGRVTDSSGRPIGPDDNICVAVGGESDNAGASPDANGRYSMTRPAGMWAVRFVPCWGGPPRYAPQYYPGIHDPDAAYTSVLPNVVIRAGRTTANIDAQLRPASSIVVDVKDPSGEPREGVCVDAGTSSNAVRPRSEVGQLWSSGSGTTDASGRATIEGLGQGRFAVSLRSCASSNTDLVRTQSWDGRVDGAEGQLVAVGLSSSRRLEVTMAAGASIGGIVTLRNAPVAGRCVIWRTGAGRPDLQTTTDETGSYQLSGISTVPGQLGACGSMISDTLGAPLWHPSSATSLTATSVTLGPGTTRSVDLALRAGSSRSVIVSGVPAARNCRVVWREYGLDPVVIPLRVASRSDVRVGDVFELPNGSSHETFRLECDGRVQGIGEWPTSSTPLYVDLGTEMDGRVTWIRYDGTGPVITPSIDPSRMAWTRSPVSVSFRCSDASGPVSSCPAPVLLDEGQKVTLAAVDRFGNSTSQPFGPMRVDRTPPAVTVGETRRTFRLDEVIDLRCSISDPRSGLRSSVNECPGPGTKGSAYGTGSWRFSIAGTDNAGNGAWVVVAVEIVK